MVKFAMGQAVSRLEDAPLLTGRGCFTDDIQLAGALHAYVLRSPHAHARIRHIDAAAARSASGVHAVLTGKDVAADGLGPMPCLVPMKNVDGTRRADTPRPILAQDRVRYVGDPVALIVADTLEQAKDAAERVVVDYESLAAVTDARAALDAQAPRVWDGPHGNCCFEWQQGDKSAVDAAFAKAAHVVRVDLVNNRCVVNSIEARSAVVDYDPATDRSTLYTPSQGPHVIHGQIADTVLKFGKDKLRIVTRQVGGSFGMKIFLYPEQCLAVWASRRLKRPVRWVSERTEAFVSDVHGRDNASLAELALDADARFLALRVTTDANLGAYLSNFGPFIPTYGTCMLAGVYKTPAIHVLVRGAFTNTVPLDAYRGAGRPEAIYLVERVVDAAARRLGLAPDELRRRNFIGPADIPYRTALGDTYDSGNFPGLMQQAIARSDWAGFAARRAEAESRGMRRGIGMAYYIETCGGGPEENARIEVHADGYVDLLVGMQDNGQGHVTSHTQILAERLGIDPARIRVIQGDTDRTPDGSTGGSRFAATGGVAVIGASDRMLDKGRAIAAHALEVAPGDVEYRDGTFVVSGTDRRLSLFDTAAAAANPSRLPDGLTPGLDADVTAKLAAPTYPNGCHVAEVEIDPATGHTKVVRYTACDDFGAVINPNMLSGQVHGGIVQGLGQALLEHTVYDPDSGQLLSGSFMDYALPRADDVPSFDISFHNIPCTTNLLGVKGAGEAGAIAAPPAAINAVVDALHRERGHTHVDMPATPERVWRLMSN
jgi:aerobic carbon-monoxide dehydrogenase large subunit